MTAGHVDSTIKTAVVTNTVFDAVLDATAILNWRNDVGDKINSNYDLLALKANKTQGAWIAPTLLNAWVNYGAGTPTAGYYKDDLGIVRLKGFVKSGTVAAAIFQLPVGYRPIGGANVPVDSNSAYGKLVVGSDGNVILSVGSNVYVDLAAVSFRAEQ